MKKSRIAGFDGIRGIAAIMVIVHHTLITWRSLGGVAVDVFLALSGFLIFGILKAARHRVDIGQSTVGEELARFWTNRALRIFPVYYCVLIFMLSAGYALHTIDRSGRA